MNVKNYVACLWCLVLPGLVLADSALTFDAAGRVDKLVLGGKNMLTSDATSGFAFEQNGAKSERLTKVAVSGNKIKVSASSGKPSFIFSIDTYPRHIAIRLLDAQGIGDGRDCTLHLALESMDIAAYTLNDLMTANVDNTRRKNTELSWPTLWGRARPDGTHGSVVLYDDRLQGSERDAVLAEIWSVQGLAGHMVRPAGQKSWTEADVLRWVEQWVAKFTTIAKVSVDAANAKELYEMTDQYVIPSKANRVYMFSNVWRAKDQGMVAVNTTIFPKGKADLLAYRNYLASHGIHLQLKSLSPQIFENYSKYINPTFVDKRIMRWASGTLVEGIDSSATTVRFRMEKNYLDQPSDLFIRIGDELIEAKKMTAADQDVWVLEGCKRGRCGSAAKSHKAGAEMAGCVHINGAFNFEDDFGQPNSIAEEICGEYGDFLNEIGVGHLHFDGTGRMGQYPWYVRDFTDYVYSRVSLPVTGSRVGGSIPANFEKEFSAAKAIEGATGYRDIRVGPRLYQKGRKHTEFSVSMLDLHFDAADGILTGSRRPTLCGGQSGGALALETMKKYGLTDYAVQLFSYWVELAPVFADADAEYLAGFMRKDGHHYQGEDVLVLGKDSAGKYIYTPHRVMGRTSGEDEPIKIDQEWGAEPRFQDIKAGTTMELLNPYAKQEPQVVVYVRHDSTVLKNPLIKVNGTGELAVEGAVQPGEYLKFEGGAKAQVYDENWNRLRELPVRKKAFAMNEGKNTVTTEAGGDSDAPELKVQYITLGPVYVLESNKRLARQS